MLIHDLDAALRAIGPAPCLTPTDAPVFSGYDMVAEIGRAASGLMSLGIEQGERVLVVAAKTWPVVPLYFACLRTGCVLVPIDADVARQHLESILDDAQPAVLIAPPEMLTLMARKLRMSRVRTALSLHADGGGTYRELCMAQQPARTSMLVRPLDLALLSYNRSRDFSRAAMFTHAALARQAALVTELAGLVPRGRFAHYLSSWGELPALAFLTAAVLAQTEVLWQAGGSAEGAASRLSDAAPNEPAPLSAFAQIDFEDAAGVARYLALPEAGIVARVAPDGVACVVTGLDARVTDGCLAIADKGIFSGYWRRVDESAAVLKAETGFCTALPAVVQADGQVRIGPQP